MKTIATLIVAAAGLMLSSTAQAETKVTLSKMHLCCGGCTKGVQKAVDSVSGVKADIKSSDGKVTLTGKDDETVQKAIDAIAGAGFHADSDSKTLKVKDDSGATKGKVKRLELTGIHNCCGSCNDQVKEAIKSVDGVTANTAEPKKDSFVVEGDFDALALVRALEGEGFHVKVKK